MQFLRVPAPFPSTVISLAPQEQFVYRRTRISAITIDPLAPTSPYTLSGPGMVKQLKTFQVPELPPQTPDLLRSQAHAELARFAYPATPPAPAPAPAPGQLQAPAGRPLQVPAPRQRLAAPAPLTPAPSTSAPSKAVPQPGAHRAGR